MTGALQWLWKVPGKIWRRSRSRSKTARGFDSAWLRYLTTLTLLTVFVFFFLMGYSWVRNVFQWIVLVTGGLVTCYYLHLLFVRMQCSLAEWMVLILALGNVGGLLFSTPHLGQIGSMAAVVATLLAALVLHGFVMGLADAQLMGVQGAVPRMLLIFANWLALPSPVLLLSGLALWLGRGESPIAVSPAMAAWAAPLIAVGGIGVVLLAVISFLVRRRAKRLLGEIR